MLLTSTEDLVKWWKEHFEDLLNPIVTPSIIKAESGEEGDDSPITDVVTSQWQGPWVGLGTPDQFFILSRIFEGVWEFVQQVYMCFCGPGQVIWLGPSGYNGGGELLWQTDRGGVRNNVDAELICYIETRAEHKNKTVKIPVGLRSCHHLWSWALGEFADTSSRN